MTIREAAEAVMRQCDGARTRDGIGFNAPDSSWFRRALKQDNWSEHKQKEARNRLSRYNGQLKELGIYLVSLTMESEPTKPVLTFEERLENQPWVTVKTAGRVIHEECGAPSWFWTRWKADRDGVKALGISVAKEDGIWVLKRTRSVTFEAVERTTLECAHLLKSWQIPSALAGCREIESRGSFADASETGVGKTFVALAIAHELGLEPLVICPLAVVTPWRDVMEIFGLKGDSVTYEKLRTGNDPRLSRINGEFNGKKTARFEFDLPENATIIWDEAHNCKNRKSLNAGMMKAAAEQGIRSILLSATLAETPMDLAVPGLLLGLFSDFWSWAGRHGCYKNRFGFGFHATGTDRKKALDKLHEEIFGAGRGVRVKKSEIPGFPENLIISDPIDMSARARAEIDADRREILRLKQEQAAQTTESKKTQGDHLTEILRLRQRVEANKIPTAVEMCKRAVEEGRSVVLFVNFSDTVKKLSEELGTDMLVHGEQKRSDRDAIVGRFQADRDHVIVCNLAAGGTGLSLHDVLGERPRESLIMPSFNARMLKQGFGRTCRTGGKSKAIQRILWCAGTIEERICRAIRRKINDISSINDGELDGENL